MNKIELAFKALDLLVKFLNKLLPVIEEEVAKHKTEK